MVTAIVMIKAKRENIKDTAEAIVDTIPEVKEVYSVAGEWDLVAIVRVKEHETLADVVTEKLRALGGIEQTQTLIAFKSYSRSDLERMWEIGLENP